MYELSAPFSWELAEIINKISQPDGASNSSTTSTTMSFTAGPPYGSKSHGNNTTCAVIISHDIGHLFNERCALI